MLLVVPIDPVLLFRVRVVPDLSEVRRKFRKPVEVPRLGLAAYGAPVTSEEHGIRRG